MDFVEDIDSEVEMNNSLEADEDEGEQSMPADKQGDVCVEADEQATNTLFCRKCGAKLPLDSVFCIRCGTKVVQ